jgi:CRISPR-associated protein Cst1
MTLLRWTGHPLADVGAATLSAMVAKEKPEDLTLEDLDQCGNEMMSCYLHPIFMSYLTCVFPNSAYVNPTTGEEKRKQAMQRLLMPHRNEPDREAIGLHCAFSGLPATHLLERSQIPMLTGSGILNFFPAGQSELAVSAPYLLAIQALPLGGRRSEGKLLIVHCDLPDWTYHFARRYLDKNRQLISLAKSNQLPEIDGPSAILDRECAGWDKAKKKPKYPDAKAPQSLIMADLTQVIVDRNTGSLSRTNTSLTVYLMSNSGQGPSLSIEQIPSQFVTFVRDVQGPQYKSKWDRVIQRAWRAAKGESEAGESTSEPLKKSSKPKKTSVSNVSPGAGISRNEAFSDLYDIFSSGFCDWNAAVRFVRRHLLCNPNKVFLDPKRTLDTAPRLDSQSLELIDWQLTSLFLERILGMTSERIALIRSFADQLAELIDNNNDKTLFRDLVFAESEYRYRGVLSKVQRQYAQDRKKLVITFDQYVDLFLDTSSEEKYRWSLVRDLISIRLVETLLAKGFFDRTGNETALAQTEEKDTVAAE